MKDVRGVNLEAQEFEFLDSCEDGEKEISMEIRGKDGFEIWKYIESKSSD